MPKARRSGAAALAEEPQPAEPVKPSRSTLGPAATGIPGAGGIFKSAAVEVLRMERRLMTTGEITKIALQRGFLKAQGKTPEATMASALYTDVKKKSGTSLFTRPQEGLFGLREWIEEGFFPEGFWAGGGPQLEFADSGVPVAVNATYRRRNTVTQHRVTQRGPDGQIITTVSGIVPAAAPAGAPAAAPAEDHEEAQPGVAGGAAAALATLTAPLVAAAAPRPASGGRAHGARAAGAAPRSGGRAAAGKGRGGATATIIATAIANSDEDGSDHYHSAADLTGGDVASQGVDAGAGGGDSSKAAAAAPSPADLLFLLGEAALADGVAPAGDAADAAALDAAEAGKRPASDDAADTNAVLEPSDVGAAPGDAAGSSGGAGPSDMDDAAAAAAAAAALVEARSSPGPSRGSAPLSGGDPLLALHEAAAGGPPHVGIDIKPQKARKRSHLAASAGGGGSVDEDRMAAALLGGMAGAPSCDAYYRDGAGGPSHAAGRARQQQQQQHHAAAPGGVDPWHMMQQMQWQQQQQYMMMAAANKGIGYFDAAAMMAGGWDPAAAAAAAAASAGGAGDLLHHMSVSLGLPPPGALPGGARRGSPAPGAAAGAPKAGGAKRRRGASGSPPAPPTPKTPGDLEKLDEWQATIESAEKALGRDHPAVGRAWLDLARALQAAGVRGDRAALAARRARDVLVAAAAAGAGGSAGEGFAYLLEKLARAAEEQEQSAAAATASAEAQRQQAAAAQQQAVAAAVEALQSALPGEHQHYHQQQQQLEAPANPDTPDAGMGEAALAAAAAAAPMETC